MVVSAEKAKAGAQEAVRKYREKNREALNARRRQRRAENNAAERAYYEMNRERILEKARERYESQRDLKLQKLKAKRDAEDKQIAAEHRRAYRINNLETLRASERKSKALCRLQHLEKYAAQAAERRARLALPPWANREAIAAIYSEARRLTSSTGVKWEVDHVIPLKNEIVCGLHVQTNLRVILKTENCSKSNRFLHDSNQNFL